MTTHPEQIGPYRILEELGEGAWARVYLAEQSEPVHIVNLQTRLELHARLRQYRTELGRVQERVDEALQELRRGREHLDVERLTHILTSMDSDGK